MMILTIQIRASCTVDLPIAVLSLKSDIDSCMIICKNPNCVLLILSMAKK